MATQKLNTLNAKNVNDLSLKDAKIAVNSKTVELSDKKSVGRVVDLGKKDFFSVSTDKNVSILELTK